MMEMKEKPVQGEDRGKKLKMFKLASENLDSNNPMLQYKAIRHIRGLSRDRSDPLKWIYEKHYDDLEDVAQKLRQNSLNNGDNAIAIEARISLELLEPYLTKHGSDTPNELKCNNCQKVVDIEWKLCPECGQNLKYNSCSKCGKNLESSWKLCPYCGYRVC
jgi:RNA polymerase subunit RPABC4/transcription elongation factor Spt4